MARRQHHAQVFGSSAAAAAAAAAASASANAPVEVKGQDLQHAVDLYQKGTEIAHSATTYDDYCRAIEHFSLAIAVRTSQPRFYLARGNAFRAINEFEHAAKDYSAAIALDDRSPVYFANRGACYRKLSQPAAALEDLTIAIEMDVKKGHHYFSRALVLYEAGYYREAIVDFTKALEDGGAGSVGTRVEYRALQTRGVCYRKLGHLAKCIDDLESAIKIDSRNSTGFSALAQAYYEQGDFDAAIEQYTLALELSKTNAAYFSHRGLCYYRKGESYARQCLADFNASIKLDGKDPQAYFYRGSMRLWIALDLLATNAAAQAAAQATAATSSAAATDASGTAHGASGSKPAGAATAMAGTSSLSSQDIALEANGGLSMSALGFLTAEEQLEAAFADIEMAWTLCPGGTQYQVGMAMIAQLKKQHDTASALFDEVGRTDRANVVVKYHAALAWHMLDAHERALVLVTDAIDAVPDEPLFFEARGLLLQDVRLHALAIADFTRALELAPERATNLYLRCESALRLEQFADAIADATSALAHGYTTDVSVYNARGMAHRGLGEYDRALSDLSVCVAAAPSNDIFRFHRGVCFMECGRYADAIPDLLAAANTNPDDSRMLYFIGLCYYHERDSSECRKFMRLALQHSPPRDILPDVFYRIGLSYALEDRNIDAVEHFTSALEHSTHLAASASAPTPSPTSQRPALSLAPPLSQLELLATQLLYVHERAKALQLERYYAEAVDDFSFVIEHNPHNAHAHFRRGFAYKALGRLADAATDFETAKLLDPTNLELVVNYKEIKDTECVILCRPGDERVF